VPPLQPGIGSEEAPAVEGGFSQAHLYAVAFQGVGLKPFCSYSTEQPEVDRLSQLTIVLTASFLRLLQL
jgi:hypothetical protein